jgi:hypothetical protein
VIAEAAISQSESGFTVTPYGQSLGLSNSDINGNASHNIFTSYAGFNIVDRDAGGNVITIALSGSIPEPRALVLLVFAGALLCLQRHRPGVTTAAMVLAGSLRDDDANEIVLKPEEYLALIHRRDDRDRHRERDQCIHRCWPRAKEGGYIPADDPIFDPWPHPGHALCCALRCEGGKHEIVSNLPQVRERRGCRLRHRHAYLRHSRYTQNQNTAHRQDSLQNVWRP